MNYAKIQAKVYKGYRIAANKIGYPAVVYRSTTGLDPIAPANVIGDFNISPNVAWSYMKANKYGNSVWQLIIDASTLNVGDYIVGINTFFIIALSKNQPLLPVLGVKCDHVVTITEPTVNMSKGSTQYGGYTKDDVTIIMQNCPCSFMMFGRSENAVAKIPTDAKLPMFYVFIPYLGSAFIKSGHIVTDQNNVNYIVIANEQTELGWRLSVRKREV